MLEILQEASYPGGGGWFKVGNLLTVMLFAGWARSKFLVTMHETPHDPRGQCLTPLEDLLLSHRGDYPDQLSNSPSEWSSLVMDLYFASSRTDET
jgi:hypothetical protein